MRQVTNRLREISDALCSFPRFDSLVANDEAELGKPSPFLFDHSVCLRAAGQDIIGVQRGRPWLFVSYSSQPGFRVREGRTPVERSWRPLPFPSIPEPS